MSKKKAGKRQLIRERRKRRTRMRRLGMIGGIGIGAVLIAFALIYPNLKSAGEIATLEAFQRPMEDGMAIGDPNAPVRIDVFEDFQCPACAFYTEEVERRIAESYVTSGQVYYVFHHYPFLDSNSVNKESHQAANASMCALEQDKFWDYHDILFANWNGENAGAFNDSRLKVFAEKIDLDMERFTSCFDENRYQEEIEADYDLGLEMGVSGTPSVFANGQQITPGFVPGFEDVQQAVEAALIASGQ
jgi:protein-disulfide isomerase